MSSLQRKHFRVPARLPARLVSHSIEARGTVADVSLSGMSIVLVAQNGGESLRILKALAADPPVHVELVLAATPIALPARIAWTRVAEGSNDVLAGVKLDADGPALRVLRSWLLRALAALRGAARHALDEQWQDAALELSTIGIDDADAPVVGAVLRYAAANTPPVSTVRQ